MPRPLPGRAVMRLGDGRDENERTEEAGVRIEVSEDEDEDEEETERGRLGRWIDKVAKERENGSEASGCKKLSDISRGPCSGGGGEKKKLARRMGEEPTLKGCPKRRGSRVARESSFFCGRRWWWIRGMDCVDLRRPGTTRMYKEFGAGSRQRRNNLNLRRCENSRRVARSFPARSFRLESISARTSHS